MRSAIVAILLIFAVPARAEEKQTSPLPVCLNCDGKGTTVESDRDRPPAGELTLPQAPNSGKGPVDVPVSIPLGTNDGSLQNMTNMQVLTK